MSVTFNDNNLSTLSKLKFGSTSYALKDAAARTQIETLDSSITSISSDISTLKGAVTSEGSILYMINANAKDAAYDTTNSIADKIAAIDSAVTLLNGGASDTGSVLNSIIANAGSGTFTFTGADSATTIAAAIQANADAIAAAGKGMFKVVTAESDIPVSAAGLGYIYLVPDVNEGYKEWIVINSGTEADPVYVKEEIGDTHIDLSDYATQAWVTSNASSADFTFTGAETATTIGAAINSVNSSIGTWTSSERSTTVKAAIESLESQVTGTTVKSVNGVAADSANQGAITIYGTDIARSSADSTTINAAISAVESDVGAWTTTGTFASGYTVKEAIEYNDSAISAIKSNTASALTGLSGGTWALDTTDSEMMVWTGITTTDATFLAGASE